MSLPKIAVKTYTTTLPISKKRVSYRPFLVKEQKILLSAVEEVRDVKDTNQVQSHLLKNFKNVMSSCITSSKIDLDKLSLVDFNYLFVQLRIASAGESVDVLYKCSCGTQKEVNIKLNDIKVEFPSKEVERTIPITEDVGVTLTLPSVRVTSEITEDGLTEADKIVKVIASSVKSIYDSENVYETDTQTVDAILEFVENIPAEKLSEIRSFFDEVPFIQYKGKVNCPEGKEDIVIREIEDFFL